MTKKTVSTKRCTFFSGGKGARLLWVRGCFFSHPLWKSSWRAGIAVNFSSFGDKTDLPPISSVLFLGPPPWPWSPPQQTFLLAPGPSRSLSMEPSSSPLTISNSLPTHKDDAKLAATNPYTSINGGGHTSSSISCLVTGGGLSSLEFCNKVGDGNIIGSNETDGTLGSNGGASPVSPVCFDCRVTTNNTVARCKECKGFLCVQCVATHQVCDVATEFVYILSCNLRNLRFCEIDHSIQWRNEWAENMPGWRSNFVLFAVQISDLSDYLATFGNTSRLQFNFEDQNYLGFNLTKIAWIQGPKVGIFKPNIRSPNTRNFGFLLLGAWNW